MRRCRFCGTQRFNGVGHRADVRGRCAAAAAENAHAESGSLPREEREIFRRRFWINDAVSFALRKTGVRHTADTEIVDFGQLTQDLEQWLRAERAICADDLYVFCLELSGGIGGPEIAVGRSLFGVSELGDDGQARERADGVDG